MHSVCSLWNLPYLQGHQTENTIFCSQIKLSILCQKWKLVFYIQTVYSNEFFQKNSFCFWYPVLAIPIDLKSRKPSGVYFRVYTTVTKWESSWIHTQTYASKSAKTTISRKKEHFTLKSHVAEEVIKSKINIKTLKNV